MLASISAFIVIYITCIIFSQALPLLREKFENSSSSQIKLQSTNQMQLQRIYNSVSLLEGGNRIYEDHINYNTLLLTVDQCQQNCIGKL